MNAYDRYLQQIENNASKGDSLSLSRTSHTNRVKAKSANTMTTRVSTNFTKSKVQPENRTKRRRKTPIVSVIVSIVGFAIAYVGYDQHETLEKWLNAVDFSLTTSSQASEAPDKSAAEKTTSEKSTTVAKNETANSTGSDAEPKSEDLNPGAESVVDFNFIKDFQERKKQLDLREEELKKLEAEILVQRESIDKKLEEVESIRKQISQQLEDRVKADEQKVDTLVQVYSQMKPQQAAKVFETIDEDLAVQILTKMKRKSAADILNLLKPDRAQALSEKYAGYKRKPAMTNATASASGSEVAQSSSEDKEETNKNNEGPKSDEKNIKP